MSVLFRSWLGAFAVVFLCVVEFSYAQDAMRHHAHIAKRALTTKANDVQSMFFSQVFC